MAWKGAGHAEEEQIMTLPCRIERLMAQIPESYLVSARFSTIDATGD
jgi:hypothetical protein